MRKFKTFVTSFAERIKRRLQGSSSPPKPENAASAHAENQPAIADPGKPRDWRAELIRQCEVLGRETARATRAIKIDPLVLKYLEEQVTGWAKAVTPTPFNPETDAFDRRTAALLNRLDEAYADHLAQAATCAADARSRREDLARLGTLKPFPGAPDILRYGAVAGIGLSVGVVIHDILPGFPPDARWGAALLLGGGFGAFLVNAALPSIRPEAAHPDLTSQGKRSLAFVAGTTTSLAFFGARLAMSRTYRDLLLAASTALMEVGVLIYVDGRGTALRAERNGWCADRHEIMRAENLIKVADDDGNAHLKAAADIKGQRECIEERHLVGRVWGADVEKATGMALGAVRAAYTAQIAINRGSGVPPAGEEQQ